MFETIAAGYAARGVDAAVWRIDAVCLAEPGAGAAMVAAAFIDAHFEPRPSGDESEQCAYRAERVAIGAAVKGKKSDNDEGDEGNHKGGGPMEPVCHATEYIAVGAGCCRRQQIVAMDVERCQQVCNHSSIGAVRLQHYRNCHDACHQRGDKEGEETPSYPGKGTMEPVEMPFAEATADGIPEVADKVLEYTQRTDDGAVDAPEDQGGKYHCGYHKHV